MTPIDENHHSSNIKLELDLGIVSSRDPTNAFLPDLHARTTTIYSAWYTRTCPVCQSKFREGDVVRLCPGVNGKSCGQAYHDDMQYDLQCWKEYFHAQNVCKKPSKDRFTGEDIPGCDFVWNGHFPDSLHKGSQEKTAQRRNERLARQFLDGLETVWKPFGERTIIQVRKGGETVGHNCPWCRFNIRAGDHIVKCPCDKCNTYFHNDIYRHLECWNEWNGSKGLSFCPTSGAKIPMEKLRRAWNETM